MGSGAHASSANGFWIIFTGRLLCARVARTLPEARPRSSLGAPTLPATDTEMEGGARSPTHDFSEAEAAECGLLTSRASQPGPCLRSLPIRGALVRLCGSVVPVSPQLEPRSSCGSRAGGRATLLVTASEAQTSEPSPGGAG